MTLRATRERVSAVVVGMVAADDPQVCVCVYVSLARYLSMVANGQYGEVAKFAGGRLVRMDGVGILVSYFGRLPFAVALASPCVKKVSC